MATFVTGLSDVQANLDRYYAGQRQSFADAMQEICVLLANDAKQDHPWTDRTANTNNSTDARISAATAEQITATLFAGMEYDIFLELARDGRWTWLWPTVMRNLDNIRAILARYGVTSAMGSARSTTNPAQSAEMTASMSETQAGMDEDITL